MRRLPLFCLCLLFAVASSGDASGRPFTAHDLVTMARQRQASRFETLKTRYNSQMTSREIRRFCQLDKESMQLLKTSVNEIGLSARAHDKVLRTARTIADIAESEDIACEHVQEAINYRMLDRQIWT